jgi:glycosyltransferase involved in cell wall biosynthesis
MISVVIAAYNAAPTLGDQLAALAAEEVGLPWEVVVADNGSTDGTRAVVSAWTDRLSGLRWVDAGQRRGPAHARNVGAAAARGRRILMCDADDIIGQGWVRQLAAALDEHPLVCGLLDRARLNPRLAAMWRDRSPVVGPRTQHDHLLVATTNNLGVRRELFEAVGGFDVSLRRGEDTDFSWRAIESGATVHVVPEAIVYMRLPSTRRGWLQRGWLDGLCSVELYLHHRGRGMRRPPARDALRAYATLLRQAPRVIGDEPAECDWAHEAGVRAGRLVGSVRRRTLFV